MLSVLISFILISLCSANDTPQRIVSLSPAHTQTLIDIGLEDKIVCAAGPLDILKTKTKIKSVGFYHKPSIELIISCKPDLIVTTFAGTPPEIHNKLKKAGYNVLVDSPKDITGIRDFILKLSKIFKIKEPKIVQTFNSICDKKTVMNGIMIIGFDPIVLVGKESFVSDAMKCSGVKNPVPGLYPRLNIETVLAYKENFLIIAVKKPESFKDYRLIEKTFNGRVLFVDPNKILMPSTKILEGIKELQKVIKDYKGPRQY